MSTNVGDALVEGNSIKMRQDLYSRQLREPIGRGRSAYVFLIEETDTIVDIQRSRK